MSEEEIINVITKMLEKNDDIFEETGNHLYFSKMTSEVIQGLLDLYNKEKEKNKKIVDKIKGKINNLEIFRKTLPIRATEIERFIGELKDLLEE